MSIKVPSNTKAQSALSKDVYHWPEFKALCERLGIDWGAFTTDITIRLRFDSVVEIDHTYNGKDIKSSEEDSDTPYHPVMYNTQYKPKEDT